MFSCSDADRVATHPDLSGDGLYPALHLPAPARQQPIPQDRTRAQHSPTTHLPARHVTASTNGIAEQSRPPSAERSPNGESSYTHPPQLSRSLRTSTHSNERRKPRPDADPYTGQLLCPRGHTSRRTGRRRQCPVDEPPFAAKGPRHEQSVTRVDERGWAEEGAYGIGHCQSRNRCWRTLGSSCRTGSGPSPPSESQSQ